MSTQIETANNAIRKALKENGIRQSNLLDEMFDHYLTEYETQIEIHEMHQEALQYTLEKIHALKGSKLNRKILFIKHKTVINMSSILLAIFISMFSFSSFHSVRTFDPPKAWPLDVSLDHVSSEFGLRIHPVKKIKKLHTGIDIKANYGQQVLATGNGIVIESSYDKTHGHYIIIKHDETYTSRFNHLAERLVSKNEKVTVGEVIGKVGSSGLSTAPHLHYEILKDGQAINPREFLKV